MAESNKTEKATPQRRKKAREQGQVARSREFGNVLAIVGVVFTLSVLSADMAAHWCSFYNGMLAAAIEGDLSADGPVLFWTTVEVLRWIGPALLVAMLLSVSVTLAQGGLNFAPSALALKFERLSPGNRLGQIFSSHHYRQSAQVAGAVLRDRVVRRDFCRGALERTHSSVGASIFAC